MWIRFAGNEMIARYVSCPSRRLPVICLNVGKHLGDSETSTKRRDHQISIIAIWLSLCLLCYISHQIQLYMCIYFMLIAAIFDSASTRMLHNIQTKVPVSTRKSCGFIRNISCLYFRLQEERHFSFRFDVYDCMRIDASHTRKLQ